MTGPLVHSLPESAELLGGAFTIDWLKGHIKEIPHVKVGKGTGRGGRIGFTDAHLAHIVAMFTVQPEAPVEDDGIVSRRRAS